MTKYHLSKSNQYQKKKKNFLQEFGSQYGYQKRIDQIRNKEYPQMKGNLISQNYPRSLYTKLNRIRFARYRYVITTKQIDLGSKLYSCFCFHMTYCTHTSYNT